MYECTTTSTLIQKVRSPRFVQLSRDVSAEVTGAFAGSTANHSLNRVISAKYEAIITAHVFLDHEYLLVLQKAQRGSLYPGQSRYATIA